MPIQVQCKSCGGKFKAPDQAEGKRTKCSKCAAVIVVKAAPPAKKKAAAGEPSVDTISVTCNCGKQLSVKASLAGRTGKCPGCGQSITIPRPGEPEPQSDWDEFGLGDLAAAEAASSPAHDPLGPPRTTPTAKSKSNKTLLIGLGVGGVAVAVLLVLAVVLLSSGDDSQVAQPNAPNSPATNQSGQSPNDAGDSDSNDQALSDAAQPAQQSQQRNRIKQLALAMVSFESAPGMFPASESARGTLPASAAIVDREGKPLLSWRVAVLPQLGELELCKQFQLDEPWDSPHNLALVAQMPDVFADASHPELAAEGKTRFLVLVHPRSVFPPAAGEMTPIPAHLPSVSPPAAGARTPGGPGGPFYLAPGTSLGEIRDGASGPLMIVQAPAQLAQVWTKPADWEVDLENAWEQLQGDDPTGVLVFAYCDGAVEAMELASDKLKANLPMIITRSGFEAIQW